MEENIHSVVVKNVEELVEKAMGFILPEYRTSDKNLECLGIAIANYCMWDGEAIMQVFMAALEDANYATLLGKVEELNQELIKERQDYLAYAEVMTGEPMI